jgi:hypothetical protein
MIFHFLVADALFPGSTDHPLSGPSKDIDTTVGEIWRSSAAHFMARPGRYIRLPRRVNRDARVEG